MHPKYNKKVSYRKQIARQHSCYRNLDRQLPYDRDVVDTVKHLFLPGKIW